MMTKAKRLQLQAIYHNANEVRSAADVGRRIDASIIKLTEKLDTNSKAEIKARDRVDITLE